jgi:hypothetical protein
MTAGIVRSAGCAAPSSAFSQNAGAGVEEAGARRPDLAARLIHHAGPQDDLGSDSGNFGDTRQPGASRRRIHHTTLLD